MGIAWGQIDILCSSAQIAIIYLLCFITFYIYICRALICLQTLCPEKYFMVKFIAFIAAEWVNHARDSLDSSDCVQLWLLLVLAEHVYRESLIRPVKIDFMFFISSHICLTTNLWKNCKSHYLHKTYSPYPMSRYHTLLVIKVCVGRVYVAGIHDFYFCLYSIVFGTETLDIYFLKKQPQAWIE